MLDLSEDWNERLRKSIILADMIPKNYIKISSLIHIIDKIMEKAEIEYDPTFVEIANNQIKKLDNPSSKYRAMVRILETYSFLNKEREKIQISKNIIKLVEEIIESDPKSIIFPLDYLGLEIPNRVPVDFSKTILDMVQKKSSLLDMEDKCILLIEQAGIFMNASEIARGEKAAKDAFEQIKEMDNFESQQVCVELLIGVILYQKVGSMLEDVSEYYFLKIKELEDDEFEQQINVHVWHLLKLSAKSDSIDHLKSVRENIDHANSRLPFNKDCQNLIFLYTSEMAAYYNRHGLDEKAKEIANMALEYYNKVPKKARILYEADFIPTLLYATNELDELSNLGLALLETQNWMEGDLIKALLDFGLRSNNSELTFKSAEYYAKKTRFQPNKRDILLEISSAYLKAKNYEKANDLLNGALKLTLKLKDKTILYKSEGIEAIIKLTLSS
jgi:hypothetical protein